MPEYLVEIILIVNSKDQDEVHALNAHAYAVLPFNIKPTAKSLLFRKIKSTNHVKLYI
jgi:hypothetical protein